MQASTSQSAEAASGGHASKIAIPRLDPQGPSGEKRDERQKEHRVNRACMSCRKRKVKCSGESPRCSNCDANNLNCVYEQARRDRLKSATHRNQALVSLLKDLSLRVDEDDRQRIQDALEGIDEDLPVSAAGSQKAPGKRRKPSTSDDGDGNTPGEAQVTASVGSNEDLDLLDENLLRNRGSRETGYVGQNSAVQWLRSLQRQMEAPEGDRLGLPYGPPGSTNEAVTQRTEAYHERRKAAKAGVIRPVTESTFYLDADSIELDLVVDPYDVPPPEVAQLLFGSFMETVHKSFPIVPNAFEDQFNKYYSAVKQNRPFEVPDKWRAILNVIFAIGSRYLHLVSSEWRTDEREHLIYMTRAIRLLGLKDPMMVIAAPDLDLIQLTGLLAFYYLAIGHVSRAWVMVGIAIRLALALGLHLRNEDPNTPQYRKDILVRTWWSLHSIECLLCSVTGRPCVLGYEDCTVSLPQAVPAEEPPRLGSPLGATRSRSEYRSPGSRSGSSSGSDGGRRNVVPRSYLDAHLTIGLITQKVLSSLYAPRTATKSWEYVQKRIPEMLKELEEWKSLALPRDGGLSATPFPSQNATRETLLLRFYYCSSKILITRPCLCRTERRIRGQSEGSANFNQKTAETCVQAAQELTGLLPDKPNPQDMYRNGPWWSIVHNIMQALSVLLLELSYQGTHMTHNDADISVCVKKLIRWLRAMRVNDGVSERAYQVVCNILKSSNPQFQASANDLLAEDDPPEDKGHRGPQQQNYNEPGSGSRDQSSAWYNSYYAPQTNGVNVGSSSLDPQLLTPLGQQPPMLPSHSDPYTLYLQDPVNNPAAYFNPFITSFDQHVPISATMDDLWPTTTAHSGPAHQANVPQGFPFSQQNPSFSPPP